MYVLGVLTILLVYVKAIPLNNNTHLRDIRQIIKNTDELGQITQAQPRLIFDLFTQRPKGREEALFENTVPLVQKETIYDYAQQFVAKLLNPQPIVDTIQEHEKYGNSGDQFRSLGNVLVGGYEGFSNFLNAASDLPIEAMKTVTRKASTYLSGIGARLAGL